MIFSSMARLGALIPGARILVVHRKRKKIKNVRKSILVPLFYSLKDICSKISFPI